MNCEKTGELEHCRLQPKNSCYAASIISHQPFASGIPELTLPDKITFGIENNIDYPNWVLLINDIL